MVPPLQHPGVHGGHPHLECLHRPRAMVVPRHQHDHLPPRSIDLRRQVLRRLINKIRNISTSNLLVATRIYKGNKSGFISRDCAVLRILKFRVVDCLFDMAFSLGWKENLLEPFVLLLRVVGNLKNGYKNHEKGSSIERSFEE